MGAERLEGMQTRQSPSSAQPIGVSHIAMLTADLDRFRRFYEDVVGLETMLVMAGEHGRHALIAAGRAILHVFEVPGFEAVDGDAFQRGRIDHFGFTLADQTALAECTARLVAAGASTGQITSFGPVLSVNFTDPDGCDGELNCLDPAFDPTPGAGDEPVDPDWHARVTTLLSGPARAQESS